MTRKRGLGRKEFGTLKVIESGNNVVIQQRVNTDALLEVLISKTDTANVQKAGQIKRGDKAVIRGILTGQPYLRRSGYINVTGDWVAELEKSSVLSIAAATK